MDNSKDEKIIKGKGGIKIGGTAHIGSTIKGKGGIRMGGKAFVGSTIKGKGGMRFGGKAPMQVSIKPKDKKSKDLFYPATLTSAEITLNISEYLHKEGLSLPPVNFEAIEETVEIVKNHWWEGIDLFIGIPNIAGIGFKTPLTKVIKKIKRYSNKE